MYRKIMVPLDGSQLSEGIVPHARSFAEALKVPVELLHVIDPEIITTFSDPEHGRYVDVVEADMQQHGIRYLEQVARKQLERRSSDAFAVTCSVVIGKPAEAIIDRAAAEPGALIAMATHGRSGVQRWLLGSVADKVLRAAANHLLLVRTTGEAKNTGAAPLKAVIVPLDGSTVAERVLPSVSFLAKKMDLEIVLLRVYSLLGSAYYGVEGYAPDLGELEGQIRGEAREYLDMKIKQLKGEGLERVSSVLLQGSGAEEIIGLARKTPENLVAMCTHGRSGVGRWVLGSVTDRVVRHSGDPVLVMRASAEGN